MCLYSRIIENPKYKPNKKNGGIVPPLRDPRVRAVPIGCGNCMECRKKKAREWQSRLLEDIKEHTNGKFVTLTFSTESLIELIEELRKQLKPPLKMPEGYELDNEIARIAMRRFLERWRKKFKQSVRHWMVTELGQEGTEHIHLHGIIWTNQKWEDIEERWGYGYVWTGDWKNDRRVNYVNEQTINYIVKYVHKMDPKHKEYKSRIFTSAGIGRNYLGEEKYAYCEQKITFNPVKRKWGIKTLIKYKYERTKPTDIFRNRFKYEDTDETYRAKSGQKISIPIYWRNKIWTDEEREELWIIKLDKQERWILGNKVDISNGEEEYYENLKHYRRLNMELGYGNTWVNWNRKEYEDQRRRLILEERIEKAKNKNKSRKA